MKIAGLDDRFIQTVTEHKVLATLKNYDPEPELERRFEGAAAIMTSKKPKIKTVSTEVTTAITKKVSKTEIHVNSGLTTAVTRTKSKTSIHAKSGHVERTGRSSHIQQGTEQG